MSEQWRDWKIKGLTFPEISQAIFGSEELRSLGYEAFVEFVGLISIWEAPGGIFEVALPCGGSKEELELISIALDRVSKVRPQLTLLTHAGNTKIDYEHFSLFHSGIERYKECPLAPAVEFEGWTITAANGDTWSWNKGLPPPTEEELEEMRRALFALREDLGEAFVLLQESPSRIWSNTSQEPDFRTYLQSFDGVPQAAEAHPGPNQIPLPFANADDIPF